MSEGPAREQAQAILNHEASEINAQDAALKRLMQRPPEDVAIRLACVFAVRGDSDSAFLWIAAATEAIFNSPFRRAMRSELTELQTSPFLASLHNDQRWINWLAAAKQALYSDVDYRVIAMLHEYLEGVEGDAAISPRWAAQ
jgi:hypothetical protein